MTLENEVFTKTDDYLAGRLSLRALFNWVFDQEPYWGEKALNSPAGNLASTIELAVFDLDAQLRSEDEARSMIAEELASLTAAGVRP